MEIPRNTSDLLVSVQDFLNYTLFTINKTEVTPASIIVFILMLAVFFVFSMVLNRLVLRRLLIRFQIDRGIRYNMVRIGHYVVMIIGALVAFQFVGIDLSGLAVIFGLLSVGIGFGLQNVTSNFVAGLILLFERPIKVGDRVTVGGTEGDVIAINMRSTTINSLNNISIIVPNSEFISSQVVNWSHRDLKVRLDIDVGVSYQSDLDTVLRSLEEVGREHKGTMDDPAPQVLLMEFGDSSWNMQLRVWLTDARYWYRTRSELNCAIVRKFRENGVEIPFPQRDLHVRSPLPVPLHTESGPREAEG
jgi:small-conductance mechanosensitive channel